MADDAELDVHLKQWLVTVTSWLRFLGLRRGVGGRRRGRHRHVHVLVMGHVPVMFPRVDAVLGHLTGRDGARDSGDLRQADWRTVGQRRVATLEQERAVVHQSSSARRRRKQRSTRSGTEIRRHLRCVIQHDTSYLNVLRLGRTAGLVQRRRHPHFSVQYPTSPLETPTIAKILFTLPKRVSA